MNIRNLKKHKTPIVVFTLAYLLLFLYHRYMNFVDETDNMLGALSVISGRDIYSGFFSQHTPFVYYFMSFFALFGAYEYETFRICMSIVILATWIFIYKRYSGYFGVITVYVIILLYPLTITFHWGHMILSDVFQAYCILFVFLEFIQYWHTKQLTTKSMIIISLSIFISIMSAFVSVYTVFILGLGFVLCEVQSNKEFKDYVNKIRMYVKLSVTLLLPFLFFIIIYFFTGNLKNFYEQAYVLNREVYSKYTNGFGESTIAVFKDISTSWISYISNTLTTFSAEKDLVGLILLIFTLFYVFQTFKKNKLLAVIIFIFIGFTSIRGFTWFHAIPYYVVTFFCTGSVINSYFNGTLNLENISFRFKKTVIGMLTFMLFLLSLNVYLPNVGANFTKPVSEMLAYPYDSYIQKYTTQEDKIWVGILYPQSYIRNHREPASKAYSIVPWFAEVYSDEIVSDLNTSKPKLIIFEPDSDVWGYKFSDFAKQIFEFIKANYTAINPNHPVEKNVYIENSYYRSIESVNNQGLDGIKDGMLIRDSLGRVFYVENGEKRHVSSPEVFEKHGFSWSDVQTFDDAVIETLVTGNPIDQ
ncbi:hypothetical protein [Paenibacillus sp. GCM10027626]|uniref:hypothetical protein n=1 Tax=Paenibacillus sp. GCM10027626 TaxID=3273411 RepID=UPI003638C698